MDEKVFQEKVLSWAHDVFGYEIKEGDFFLDDSFHVGDLTAFVFASSDVVELRLLVLSDVFGNLLAGAMVDEKSKSVAVNDDSEIVSRICSTLSEKFADKSYALIRYEKGATAHWWQKTKWASYWLLFPCCVVFSLVMTLLHAKAALGDNWPIILTTVFSLWTTDYLSGKYGLGNLSDKVKDEIAVRAILTMAKRLSENKSV